MNHEDEILDTLKKMLANQEQALALQRAAGERVGAAQDRIEASRKLVKRAMVVGLVMFIVVIGVIAFVIYKIETTAP
jgi:hypothetical protein